MITDIDSFLRYFDAVHRRAVRDVAALPPEAERWAPPALRQAQGERGENAWGIGEIVRHMAGTRMYFARAYRDEGWIADWPPPINTEDQSTWLPALEASAAMAALLLGTGLVAGLFAALEADGLGEQGTQALVKTLEKAAGVEVH